MERHRVRESTLGFIELERGDPQVEEHPDKNLILFKLGSYVGDCIVDSPD